jgi:hypothetical protein
VGHVLPNEKNAHLGPGRSLPPPRRRSLRTALHKEHSLIPQAGWPHHSVARNRRAPALVVVLGRRLPRLPGKARAPGLPAQAKMPGSSTDLGTRE